MKEKRKILILLALPLFFLIIHQLNAQDYMRVNLKNGTVMEFDIASIQKLTFDLLTNDLEHRNTMNQLLKMKLYPNPVKEFVYVDYHLPVNGSVLLNIFTIEGKIVNSIELGDKKAGNQNYRLMTTNMKAGSYICVIRQNNDFVSKIIIVKN